MEKATIDIEDLLIWAYRDMVIDRTTLLREDREPPPAWSPGFGALKMIAELGLLIPTTGAGMDAPGSTAHEDADRVHAAVLRLEEMFIEAGDDHAQVWDRAEEEALGFSIRKTARGFEVRQADGPARPVERAVTSALVVLHAKRGDRPDVYEGWRPGQPMRIDARGRHVPDHEAAEISAQEVSVARARYHVWRAALAALAEELAGELELFTVTGPRAPAAPWWEEQREKKIIDIGPMCEATHAKLLEKRRKKAI